MVYDCKNIIKGLKHNGECMLLNEKILHDFVETGNNGQFTKDATKKYKASKFYSLGPSQKIKIAVFSGCDYLDSVRGLGFGTVIDYMPEHESRLWSKIKKQS